MSDIFQAAREGNLARVEELLAKGGLDLTAFESRWDKLTALYRAAQGGYLDVAEALIHAGAPLNVPDEDQSPLHGAATCSQHDMSTMLLREGAEVDAHSKYGSTPLFYARDRRMAALLIAAGADVNAGALRFAAIDGRLDVLEELLSRPDIKVNSQSGKVQGTALHFAAHCHHLECVAALLAAGADARIVDAKGNTPLLHFFVVDDDNTGFRIVAMLVAAGDRQWACVPSPCPGLEAALLPVWEDAPEELVQLFSHLEDPVKRRIQAALCTLHHASPRHLPDHICMRLLDEAFNV